MKLSTKGRSAVMAMADLATNCGGHPVSPADVCPRRVLGTSGLFDTEAARDKIAELRVVR